MPSLFMSSEKFKIFLDRLRGEYELFAPKELLENLHYEPLKHELENHIVLDTYRAVEPLKGFLYKLKEPVAGFPASVQPAAKKIALLGVKSCDLRSLRVLDSIFDTEEFKDPFYTSQRDAALLISSDCYSPSERCFCNLVGLKPYPEEGFDLNLSSVEGGFVVEIGSDKGEELVRSYEGLFEEAAEEKLSQRDGKREASLRKLSEQNKAYETERSYQQIVSEATESDVWEEQAERCVECGCCNLICPTCYCFLLVDERAEEGFQRLRSWDSCMYAGFSRVAAGTNPRARLGERLRHRFMHKFVYIPDELGIYGCTGCGRCGEGCLANIDVREVLKELNLKTGG